MWQCNSKGRAVLVLWKNEYICLRGALGFTETERNGGAKRATGCRSVGRLVRASARTPCGVLNCAFRKVLEYSAGSTRILCGRYCGGFRMGGRGEAVRRAGHCGVWDAVCGISGCVFLPRDLFRGCLGFDFYRTSQGLPTSRVGFPVRTARFGAFPNSVFVRLVAVFLCRGRESASKCMP